MTLHLGDVPDLSNPIFVAMLSGWVDSGFAGAGAATVLRGALKEAIDIGTFDLVDDADLTECHPNIEVQQGRIVDLGYPSIRVTVGRAGRDVVLMHGPEPALHWQQFCSDVVELALGLGVTTAVVLGGMPAMVTHRAQIEVRSTVTGEDMVEIWGPARFDYVGPTGAQSVIQALLGSSGVPSVGLWAQIPLYLTSMPCPPAIVALLRKLRDVAGLDIDLSMFDRQAAAYLDKVEEQLRERSDLADMIDKVEELTALAESPTVGTVGIGVDPSEIEDLMADIERFLGNDGT